MDPRALRVWLEYELTVHRHLLKQHETARDNGANAVQRETGRVMAKARRAMIGELESELGHVARPAPQEAT